MAETIRLPNGLLSGGGNIRAVLESSLSPRQLYQHSTEIESAEKHGYVKYEPRFLDEPELDHQIAADLMIMKDIKGIQLCDPRTVRIIRLYKAKPRYYAELMGMDGMARRFLSKRWPAETRSQGYYMFNLAIEKDRKLGVRLFAGIMSTLPLFFSDEQRYPAFIDSLYHGRMMLSPWHLKWSATRAFNDEDRVKAYFGSDNTGYHRYFSSFSSVPVKLLPGRQTVRFLMLR